MKKFTHQFQVRAPLQRVVDFHNHPSVLKMLTPPPIFLKFHRLEPMREGSSVEFTIWLGPFPVSWKATHSDVDPQKGFTDSQTEGPFENWIHHHRFISVEKSTTTVIDEIQAIPGKAGYRAIMSRIMWATLPILFKFREIRTRLALEMSPNHQEVLTGSRR